MIAVIHHYVISSFIYGDICIFYEDRFSGPLLGICIVLLVGSLRNSYDALKIANSNLDHRVAERNAALSNLTVKLIEDAESTRISHGQMLHDGIGQQLTGIQLYCTSLAEQLVFERNPSASLAFSMRARAEMAHGIIRKTARLLFPVRMHETGLIPALNELSSCFDEIKHVSFALELDGDFSDIPDELALALYRIFHESAMCAATALSASTIQLSINEDAAGYEVTLQHNGASWLQLHDNIEQQLILYRLQSLGGTLSVNQPVSGFETIIYRIPNT